ncbi:MAG: hypothetical protein JXA22_00330 [Candidatus Thermoplasmatota archaeon]|nr:hypothetical protein [Candidatus Thermoplasmatota archaeon]
MEEKREHALEVEKEEDAKKKEGRPQAEIVLVWVLSGKLNIPSSLASPGSPEPFWEHGVTW